MISVPSWLTDKDAVAPCPCQNNSFPPMLVLEGPTGLKTWYHVHCLPLTDKFSAGELEVVDDDDEGDDDG